MVLKTWKTRTSGTVRALPLLRRVVVLENHAKKASILGVQADLGSSCHLRRSTDRAGLRGWVKSSTTMQVCNSKVLGRMLSSHGLKLNARWDFAARYVVFMYFCWQLMLTSNNLAVFWLAIYSPPRANCPLEPKPQTSRSKSSTVHYESSGLHQRVLEMVGRYQSFVARS
jgi:hypothetical protein